MPVAVTTNPSLEKLGRSWSKYDPIEVHPRYGGERNGRPAAGSPGPLQVTGEIESSAVRFSSGVAVGVGVLLGVPFER
jgi:hypothetical protein